MDSKFRLFNMKAYMEGIVLANVFCFETICKNVHATIDFKVNLNNNKIESTELISFE